MSDRKVAPGLVLMNSIARASVPDAPNPIPCPACGGSGEDEDYTRDPWKPSEDDPEPWICARCAGAGMVVDACVDCGDEDGLRPCDHCHSQVCRHCVYDGECPGCFDPHSELAVLLNDIGAAVRASGSLALKLEVSTPLLQARRLLWRIAPRPRGAKHRREEV